MNEPAALNKTPEDEQRLNRLVAQLVDGDLSEAELEELNWLMAAVPHGVATVVDHLLLDSLLGNDLGAESLTALVDLVADPEAEATPIGHDAAAAEPPVLRRETDSRNRWYLRTAGGLIVTACVTAVAFLLSNRADNRAYASATEVVEAAMQTHTEPVERVYVVEVERNPAAAAGFGFPGNVKIATQGDRFWAEMNGFRRWTWGRNADGAIWMTAGQHRAVMVGPEEMGLPLRHLSDLYTLHLETLLEGVLKYCRLEQSAGSDGTDVITAVPQWRWTDRPLRRATIEVDRETKAIRRLVIERELPGRVSSTVTFTLVESRVADDDLYRPEGHLKEPFRVVSRETPPERRRELMMNWFGPAAEHWIEQPEPRR